MEGAGRRHRHRVLVAAGSGVRGDRTRAVGVDDAAELGGDLVERLDAGHLLERAVGAAPQRSAKPIRVGHLVGELAALDARVPLEERIVHHPADGDHAVVDDVDLHRAACVAHPTERVFVCWDAGAMSCDDAMRALRSVSVRP